MKKAYILHENSEWTKPLLQALDQRNIPYEEWFLDQGVLDFNALPPDGVFYNRMSASSHTRDHRFAPEYTAQVLSWLEAHNKIILNGRNALRLEISKLEQYEALKKFDILVPRTIGAIGSAALIEAALQWTTPFITKHNRAGKGLGVELFSSSKSFQKSLDTNNLYPSIDGIMLLQEYIDAPSNSITRAEFIDGKFFYAVEVDTSSGFQLCPADSCQLSESNCPLTNSDSKFRILDSFDPVLIEKYEQFLSEHDIAMAGIESIQDAKGNRYTYDVNTNTNYNKEAELIANIYGMEAIADCIATNLAQID